MADNLFEGLPPPSSQPQNHEQEREQQPAPTTKKRESSPLPAPAPILKSALKKPKTGSEGLPILFSFMFLFFPLIFLNQNLNWGIGLAFWKLG